MKLYRITDARTGQLLYLSWMTEEEKDRVVQQYKSAGYIPVVKQEK